MRDDDGIELLLEREDLPREGIKLGRRHWFAHFKTVHPGQLSCNLIAHGINLPFQIGGVNEGLISDCRPGKRDSHQDPVPANE